MKFFKLPRHRQFEYKTRHWDPRQEELQERLRRAGERKSDGISATKARIAGGFRNKGYGYTGDSAFRRRQAARSNLILISAIVVLLLLSYLILTVYLPRIVQMIENTGN